MAYDNEFLSGEEFLSESKLTKIATQLDELIIKFDALPRFQEMVIAWDEEMGRKLAARAEWEERRRAHEQKALTQRRLLDKNAKPPEPGWRFEGFRLRDIADKPVAGGVGPVIGAWFPPELCWDACLEVGWPLPVPRVEVKLYEMYAALSAIYDRTIKGNRKINPWADDPDELAGIRYYDLMDMVPNLPESDESHLTAWIRRIEKDLKAPKTDRPMLSTDASLVYELLLALGEHRAMNGPNIVQAVFNKHHKNLDESTLRKTILPALKPYGLEHVPRIGYRIKPSRRATNQ